MPSSPYDLNNVERNVKHQTIIILIKSCHFFLKEVHKIMPIFPNVSMPGERTILLLFIGLDKSGNQVNSFLINGRKHMLWVLIRSASASAF